MPLLQSESTVVFQQRRLGGMDSWLDEWMTLTKNLGPDLRLLFKTDEMFGFSFGFSGK